MLSSSHRFRLLAFLAATLLLGSAFHFLPALIFTFLGLLMYGNLWKSCDSLGSFSLETVSEAPSTWVLVACRNESTNIHAFFSALRASNTPIAGLIWVDDHSSDDSWQQAQKESKDCTFLVKLLSLPPGQEGKKAALNAGHLHIPAEADWVWFTDVDCRIQPQSLTCLTQVAPRGGVVLGQIAFDGGPGMLSQYQKMENAALLALTQWGLSRGHLLMANGGNLLVHPRLIQPLNSKHSSSGDDIFALEKTHLHHPELFTFASCPEAAVRTSVETRWADFIQQRLRWMRKTPLQLDKSSFALQIALGLFAFSPLLFLGLGLFFAPDESVEYGLLAASLWLGKAFIDQVVLAPSIRKRGQDISSAWLLSILQTLWFPLLGLLALWPGNFAWKGRRFYR